ncbi:MAG: FadR family transcriptional regulator [Candidatus Abyssobacteria bacterium SURF_5]|uniref:FadR family transcriptional regulator n=1 Tax=Abyssobacteria bacterium (strain SURF_5) TaxID=2093360 RepID=A0A3A4NYX7_ABYX5|nr:MAG: FadR family transcriptional regulator [Candidatus Abyssubacteria bacterium SURF_5]
MIMATLNASKSADSAPQDGALHFRPVEKTTLSGEIVDQILSMIVTGKLKAGDRLPPERELCESFKVGRGSVREAMKALEILGIIRRDVPGTTICRPEENRYLGLSLTTGAASLEQALESARIVGIETAGLAAERAKPAHIRKMAQKVKESEDTQNPAAIHLSYHRALAAAAQNPVLSQIYSMLIALVAQSRSLVLTYQNMDEKKLEKVAREIFDGHKKILKAIESHNPISARRCMKEHYDCMESVALGK